VISISIFSLGSLKSSLATFAFVVHHSPKTRSIAFKIFVFQLLFGHIKAERLLVSRVISFIERKFLI